MNVICESDSLSMLFVLEDGHPLIHMRHRYPVSRNTCFMMEISTSTTLFIKETHVEIDLLNMMLLLRCCSYFSFLSF